MKLGKKIVSLLLATMMVLAMFGTAMAADSTTTKSGKITVDKAVPGQAYTIYRIFDLESFETGTDYDPTTEKQDTTGKYSYKVSAGWADFFKTGAKGADYVEIDAKGYVVEWKTGADAAAFAKDALAYATTDPAPTGIVSESKTAGDAPAGQDTTTVEFTNQPLGYYLMDSTLGVLCSLDTNNPNVTIHEKNGTPSIDKKVQEDSKVDQADEWGNVNDADIAQEVKYKSVVTAKKGAADYTVHDVMDPVLHFDGVKKIADNKGNTLTEGTDYTVNTPAEGATALADGCTFEVVFTETYLNGITEDDDRIITIEYSAHLTDSAVAGVPYENKTQLEYNNHVKTAWVSTNTYTWTMDVQKYTGDLKGTHTKLNGVKFVLLNSNKTKVATVVNDKVTGWVDVPQAVDGVITWPANTTLTTKTIENVDGKIVITGLDADSYNLREIETLPGYNKLIDDIAFSITTQTKTNDAGDELTGQKVQLVCHKDVQNNTGIEMPATGGMGTTILYVVGGLLVVAAAVLLVTKKRVGAEK